MKLIQRRVFTIVLMLSGVLLVNSNLWQCSSVTVVSPTQAKLPDAPTWFFTPPVDSLFIYGVGQATDSDSSLAIQKAVAFARREIIESLRTEFSASTEQNSQSGTSSSHSDEYTAVLKSMVSGILSGSEIERIVWSGEHRVFVLVRYPKPIAAKQVGS